MLLLQPYLQQRMELLRRCCASISSIFAELQKNRKFARASGIVSIPGLESSPRRGLQGPWPFDSPSSEVRQEELGGEVMVEGGGVRI